MPFSHSNSAHVKHSVSRHPVRHERRCQHDPMRGDDLITLRCGTRPVTRDLLLRIIRAQDHLMREFGCDAAQRAWVHSGARGDMLCACQTSADRQLVIQAFQTALSNGTVPTAEGVWSLVSRADYESPAIDKAAMSEASERLMRELSADGEEGAAP